MRLEWSGVTGAYKYRVERANSASGSYSYIGQLRSTAYMDRTAASGRTYYYRVQACSDSSGGCGNYSATDSNESQAGGLRHLAAPYFWRHTELHHRPLPEMINFADYSRAGTARNTNIPLSPSLWSEKGTIKVTPTGALVRPTQPRFIFIAIKDRGLVDVFDIGTAERIRSIEMGGTPAVLSSYWRQ